MSSDDLINREMTDGYRDGLNPNSPEPSATRTQSYRYGFLNGRDDLRRKLCGLDESTAAPRLKSPAARELVLTYGMESAARDGNGLSERITDGEISVKPPPK
jgi:hypothetical protein